MNSFSTQAFAFDGNLETLDIKHLTQIFKEAMNLPIIEKVGDRNTGASITDESYNQASCVMEFSLTDSIKHTIVGQGQPYTRARFNVKTGAFALFHQATGTWHDWGSYQTWWATYALSQKTVPYTDGKTHIRNVAWLSFDGTTGVRYSFEYYDSHTGNYVSTTGIVGTRTVPIDDQQYTVPSFKVQVQGSDIEYTDVRIFAAIHALGLIVEDVEGDICALSVWQTPRDAAGPTVAFKIKNPDWGTRTNWLKVLFNAASRGFSYIPHSIFKKTPIDVPFLGYNGPMVEHIALG